MCACMYQSFIFFLPPFCLYWRNKLLAAGVRCLQRITLLCALCFFLFFSFLSGVIMFFLSCDPILSCLSDCVPTNIKRTASFPPITRPPAICPSSPRLPDSLAVCLCGRTGAGTYACVPTLAGDLLCSYLWCVSHPLWGPPWMCRFYASRSVFFLFFFHDFHLASSNFKRNCKQVLSGFL